MKRSLIVLAISATLATVFALGWLGVQRPASSFGQLTQTHAVDIGFAQFMGIHHRQAIAMAQLMLDGRPTPLRRMAQNIAYAQLQELGEMQGWLGLWDQSLRPKSNSMTWMLAADQPPGPELKQYLIECERSPRGMPGLASAAELQQLHSLNGVERDRHFLNLMLAHHQGGLPMARFAAQHAREKVVRKRAAAMALEQTQEIHLMSRTLAAMPLAAAQD